MKWYTLQPRLFESEHELALYDFLAARILVVSICDEATAKQGRSPTLVFEIPADEEHDIWPADVSDEEFAKILRRTCRERPEYADLIRRAAPTKRPATLSLSRTGPACPPIVPLYESYVINESLREKIADFPGIKLLNATLAHVVRVEWDLGQPVPARFAEADPEDFVKNGQHDDSVRKQMGKFYELFLPEHPWLKSEEVSAVRMPTTNVVTERLFVDPDSGALRTDFREICFSGEKPLPPWVRLVPATDKSLPAYHLVREDVYDILRESGKWTLEFREVEQF